MKILVLSDSHGDLNGMIAAYMREKPDITIHLGDHTADAAELKKRFPDIKLCVVKGNCDYSSKHPTLARLEIGGKRIIFTHGHAFHVKNGYTTLYIAGMEAHADVVLFGHTHIPLETEYQGMLFLNPGSCGKGTRRTYGLLDISSDGITTQIREVQNGI